MNNELSKVKAKVSNVIHHLMTKVAGRTAGLGTFPLFVDDDYRRVEDMLDAAFTTLEATLQQHLTVDSANAPNILTPDAAPLTPKTKK